MEPHFQVGQYVLERPLGEGGMGEVWLGRNIHLGTPVAVKFLNPAYTSSPDVQQRFLNEGRRQGGLNHPNIVKVYGFEVVDSRSFLILQYVDSGSLEDVLRKHRRVETNAALRIGITILNALDYAHEHAMVHRDIKPSNILLDSNGFPYLGDFGIVLATNEKRVTRTGTSMGTALYMSPEQITRPGAVDRRSDIYSFGCVLYEMLAGNPPFNPASEIGEDTEFATKMAHVQQPPPPLRQANPTVSPAIEAVVMRCLAKDPAHRFSTCRELRDALAAAALAPALPEQRAATVFESPAFPAPVLPLPSSGHGVLLVAAIVAVLCVGVVSVPPPMGNSNAAIVSLVGIICFGAGALAGGFWQDRAGPRVPAITGSLLALAGYFIGFGTGNLNMISFGRGLLAGAGTGMVYISAISSTVQWFPKRRGLTSGCVTAAYWLGKFLMIELVRWRGTNLLIATPVLMPLITAACCFKVPPAHFKYERAGIPFGRAVTTGRFWLLWSMLLLLLIGAGVVANLTIYERHRVSPVLFLPALIGIIWAFLSDKIGPAMVFSMLFATEAIAAFLWFGTTSNLPALIMQLCFGGALCVMPSFVAGMFGTAALGRVYGLILLAWPISTVVSTALFSSVHSQNGVNNLLAAIAIAMLASVALPRLMKRPAT